MTVIVGGTFTQTHSLTRHIIGTLVWTKHLNVKLCFSDPTIADLFVFLRHTNSYMGTGPRPIDTEQSEDATPKLFAIYIYIQNYANQECKWKCILMFNYCVVHTSKSFTDVVTRKHIKAI